MPSIFFRFFRTYRKTELDDKWVGFQFSSMILSLTRREWIELAIISRHIDWLDMTNNASYWKESRQRWTTSLESTKAFPCSLRKFKWSVQSLTDIKPNKYLEKKKTNTNISYLFACLCHKLAQFISLPSIGTFHINEHAAHNTLD